MNISEDHEKVDDDDDDDDDDDGDHRGWNVTPSPRDMVRTRRARVDRRGGAASSDDGMDVYVDVDVDVGSPAIRSAPGTSSPRGRR
jgi:arginase family enzyme